MYLICLFLFLLVDVINFSCFFQSVTSIWMHEFGSFHVQLLSLSLPVSVFVYLCVCVCVRFKWCHYFRKCFWTVLWMKCMNWRPQKQRPKTNLKPPNSIQLFSSIQQKPVTNHSVFFSRNLLARVDIKHFSLYVKISMSFV